MSIDTSTGSASRTIPAAATAIYDTITDLARMGEWSPECVGVTIDGPALPGTTFTGHNERGDTRWTSECSVLVAQRPNRFAFVAGLDPATSTVWTYEIEELGDGRSQVTESFDSARLRNPEWRERLAGRRRQLLDDMAETLASLAEAVAR